MEFVYYVSGIILVVPTLVGIFVKLFRVGLSEVLLSEQKELINTLHARLDQCEKRIESLENENARLSRMVHAGPTSRHKW